MNLNEAIQYKEASKCVDRPGKCASVIEWLIEQLENQDEQKDHSSRTQAKETRS